MLPLQKLTAELVHSEGHSEFDFVDSQLVGAQDGLSCRKWLFVCYINAVGREPFVAINFTQLNFLDWTELSEKLGFPEQTCVLQFLRQADYIDHVVLNYSNVF